MSANDRIGRSDRTDLDRVLGEWLAEGPARAPQAPLAAARDHARAHPRRRDPLAFLRPDPMPARGSGRTLFGMAPATVVAVVALTAALVGGAVWVGSQLDGPGPVPLPSPAPTETPRPTPEPTPEPSLFQVTLDTDGPVDPSVVVLDRTGTLVEPRWGPEGDGVSVPTGVLEVENLDERTLRLTWSSLFCADEYEVDIAPGAVLTITVGVPECEGDAMGIDRILDLEFEAPVDAATVKRGVIELPAPSATP